MRFKFIGVALILLIGTPAFSEPITVDTFPPDPSAVWSGDIFTVRYRIRYLDLADINKELVFYSGEVLLENMQGVAHPFRVIDIDEHDLIFEDGEDMLVYVFMCTVVDLDNGF